MTLALVVAAVHLGLQGAQTTAAEDVPHPSAHTPAQIGEPRVACSSEAAIRSLTGRRFDPATNSMEQLRRLLMFSRRFVQTLHLRQLPSHLDLSLVFQCMIK